MFICTLFTAPLEKREPGKETEHGDFGCEIEISDTILRQSGDPLAYVQSYIAATLAKAVQETGVPRDYWFSTFSREAQRAFHFPKRVNWK